MKRTVIRGQAFVSLRTLQPFLRTNNKCNGGLERDCGDNKRGLQRMKSIREAGECLEQMNLETTNSESKAIPSIVPGFCDSRFPSDSSCIRVLLIASYRRVTKSRSFSRL